MVASGTGQKRSFHRSGSDRDRRKYGKTAAQVNLRFLIQSGVVVIPKSTHKERMEENFDLFDFSLTEEDREYIQKSKWNLLKLPESCYNRK